MTNWVKVTGDVCPLEVDIISSKTTVYERRNAHLVQQECEGETVNVWEYEERTYTMQEYAALLAKRTADTLDAVEAQSLYTAVMTDTLIEEG